MGRKTVYFAMGSSVLSALMTIISIWLPFNTLTFYTLKAAVVGSLKIKLLSASADMTKGDFCNTIGNFVKFDFCEDIRGSHDLLEISHRFCAPLVDKLFRNSCNAFSSCYALGLGTTILSIVNLLLQGTAAWLIHHYMQNSPKKKYREVSFILVIVGTVLIAICLGLWFGLVSIQIDNITVLPLLDLAIDVSKGWSTSIGYWLLWVSLIIQIVQIILYRYGKISDEARLIEAKMQQEFEAELAMGAGGDPYGYNNGYNQDPYNQDPYSQGYNGQQPASAGYGQSPGYGPSPYGAQPGSAPQYPQMYQPQQMPPSWGAGGFQAAGPPMPQGPGGGWH